jgi:hypothetical protein
MNILAGSVTAVGTIKATAHGTTAAGPRGAQGIGSGVAIALTTGERPGKTRLVIRIY